MAVGEPQSNRSRIILGVDDAAENLDFLKALLGSAGYTFFGFLNGAECVQFVTRIQPRLILLDIEMRGLDGFETCERLRKMPDLAEVPIVFQTSRKTSEDVRAGLAAGGNDFLIKPYDRNQLLKRVNHWLNHRPARPG